MTDLHNKLNPYFVYGTAWKENNTEKLTKMALDTGFRAIDTANQRKHYYEEGVGNAISAFLEETDMERDDLFIQTKYTYEEGQDHRLPYDANADPATQIRQSFESSLQHLKTTYLDSYVLHGPSTGRGLTSRDIEVWNEMESLVDEGLTHSIGVSNIRTNQLELLLEEASIKPAFIQNRCFAQNGWDYTTRKVCRDNDIIYQGFSLLTANRQYIKHQKISDLANKYKITIPGVIFSFAKQIGMLPLTGTTDQQHMQQDLDAIGIELEKEELAMIEKIAL